MISITGSLDTPLFIPVANDCVNVVIPLHVILIQLRLSVYRFGNVFNTVDTCIIDVSPRLLPDNNNDVIENCDCNDWKNAGLSDGRSPQFDNSTVNGLTFD